MPIVVPSVLLSGGEPLMRPELFAFAEYARRLSLDSPALDELLDELRHITGAAHVFTDGDLSAFTQDWRRRAHGKALAVVRRIRPRVVLGFGGYAAGPGGNAGINRPAIKDFGMHGLLGALDVTTGQMVARFPTHYDNESGVLATSGGIVFTATVDGTISAHNDETLEQLWSFNTGYGIKSPVISYAVDGKQYIAILAGGNLTTAGLQADFPEIITNKIPGGALFVFAL